MKKATDLYDPLEEHDACGVGFVARLDARADHALVDDAISALARMAHRGGAGHDPNQADGAGLLMPIPRLFMQRVWGSLRGPMPEKYGIGHFFLPQNTKQRERAEEIVESSLRAQGLHPVAWRDTPLRTDALFPAALETLPVIRQLLVDASECPEDALERRLFIARRRMETTVAKAMAFPRRDFHVASLSSHSIIYKGMLPGSQLAALYPDLADRDFAVHFAIFHERYSTNTTPAWRLAQPFRCLAHNGEINTLRCNQNAMAMREPLLSSPLFGSEMVHMLPVLDDLGSDSAMLDNAMEMLVHSGRSLPHATMMLIPEPFGKQFILGDDKRAFYEYHAALMEPWDGPAALVFTDGHRQIGAVLDRNALRPSRYLITKDGKFLLASEAGVLDIPPSQIARRGRLQPRRMLLVDFARHRVVTDAECKGRVIGGKPYRHWLSKHGIHLHDLPLPARSPEDAPALPLPVTKQLFGYAGEDLTDIITPMAKDAQEPVASMGDDTPLAVLSQKPQLLFRYFKQRFAQVTNPPIDPLREELVMSLKGFVGKRGNLLEETPEHYAQLRLSHPVLLADDLARIRASDHPKARTAELAMLFPKPADLSGRHSAGDALKQGLDALFTAAEKALDNGASILLLSDRKADAATVPLPSLLAVAGLDQHLMGKGRRHACGILVDTGEAREVMHVAQLLAFGAGGVHPRAALEIVAEMAAQGELGDGTARTATDAYVTAIKKGLLKTFARMGISTVRSFCGGQGFVALGIATDVAQDYFSGIPSRLDGIGLDHIALDALARHAAAFPEGEAVKDIVDTGTHRYRSGGERHLWTPEAVRALHRAVREDDYAAYREYAAVSDNQEEAPVTLRGLFRFQDRAPVPLEEVEPEEAITPRFVGAAMSFGSISKEAHEAVAIALNRVGGRSNSGEGGEDPERAILLPDGSDRRSHIRQLASGRFGVTATYLAQADEIQIKMAQGAKPGEGGQLPAHKVLPEIARVRRTIPGVTLISPPPHHDIYSIEDLAQLIFDLKCLHPPARVSVKLVAGVGVGTIATGVAKAGADTIIISGHDGGTGASPRTAIRHVGMPWELGLAEAQTALIQSNLRSSLTLQTDGQLRTGRDLVVAALLGAEEYALGTGLLVSLGCCMLRVCHKGTCAVGVATQDPRLRANFSGKPDHAERFLRFLARDMREHMARLGFRTVNEMIGRSEALRIAPSAIGSKTSLLNLNPLIAGNDQSSGQRRSAPFTVRTDPPLDSAMLAALMPGILAERPTRFEGIVHNADRTVGTRIAGEIARLHGDAGMTPGSVDIHLTGTAGQSAGAFLTRGITLRIAGEANDYAGKGLSGGVLIVAPPVASSSAIFAVGEEQAAVGNVALYGATGGEAFFSGSAGERFAVRNSGATTVVEGVGDHACEYMTGGVVVVLGSTGYNFAAGMSGGTAYVYDRSEQFLTRCNMDSIDIESVWQKDDVMLLRTLLTKHMRHTGSALARSLLDDWQTVLPLFLKVTPIEYQRALGRMKLADARDAVSISATEEVYI
ncbi:MAG: glutamate synthase large subunit [Deltaproteobacteria bacterium]|jgi:glutamate synthase domain-containing protein 2/glutamate synthase domain-containing protein 1/glutamate synthase domain-containing protein 3|nr:glutamate synthase large subunit [Deltaproteobacteria bacterium]